MRPGGARGNPSTLEALPLTADGFDFFANPALSSTLPSREPKPKVKQGRAERQVGLRLVLINQAPAVAFRFSSVAEEPDFSWVGSRVCEEQDGENGESTIQDSEFGADVEHTIPYTTSADDAAEESNGETEEEHGEGSEIEKSETVELGPEMGGIVEESNGETEEGHGPGNPVEKSEVVETGTEMGGIAEEETVTGAESGVSDILLECKDVKDGTVGQLSSDEDDPFAGEEDANMGVEGSLEQPTNDQGTSESDDGHSQEVCVGSCGRSEVAEDWWSELTDVEVPQDVLELVEEMGAGDVGEAAAEGMDSAVKGVLMDLDMNTVPKLDAGGWEFSELVDGEEDIGKEDGVADGSTTHGGENNFDWVDASDKENSQQQWEAGMHEKAEEPVYVEQDADNSYSDLVDSDVLVGFEEDGEIGETEKTGGTVGEREWIGDLEGANKTSENMQNELMPANVDEEGGSQLLETIAGSENGVDACEEVYAVQYEGLENGTDSGVTGNSMEVGLDETCTITAAGKEGRHRRGYFLKTIAKVLISLLICSFVLIPMINRPNRAIHDNAAIMMPPGLHVAWDDGIVCPSQAERSLGIKKCPANTAERSLSDGMPEEFSEDSAEGAGRGWDSVPAVWLLNILLCGLFWPIPRPPVTTSFCFLFLLFVACGSTVVYKAQWVYLAYKSPKLRTRHW